MEIKVIVARQVLLSSKVPLILNIHSDWTDPLSRFTFPRSPNREAVLELVDVGPCSCCEICLGAKAVVGRL